jgi:hypothetical protein
MRKILTIILEFDLGDRKTHGSRLKGAYEAVRSEAIRAIERELLERSIAEVTTRMFYDYRQYSAVDK